MKKLFLLTIIVVGSVNLIYSQNEQANNAVSSFKKDSIIWNSNLEPKPEDVYIICTPMEYDPADPYKIKEGVSRIKTLDTIIYDSPSISYYFQSRSKGYGIEFHHDDYKIEYISKRSTLWKPSSKMNILVVPKKFLSKIKLIDLDKRGPSMTEEEALAFRNSLRGKIIWMIDRRDITEKSVKLVQVWVLIPTF